MIKLEDISALALREHFTETEKHLLERNNIYNYQELKNYLEEATKTNFSTKSILTLTKRVAEVEKKITKLNQKNYQPIKYFANNVLDEKLSQNDLEVYGNSLILWNPTTKLWNQYEAIKNLNIYEIKYLLCHLDEFDGKNALTKERNIGNDRVFKVIEAINHYQDQILRQFQENKTTNNLFYLNQTPKKELATESIKDIVTYLLDNVTKEFVWGQITDSQKLKMQSAVTNNKQVDLIIKKHLCKIVTDYTTLSELEHTSTRNQAIKRLIKK